MPRKLDPRRREARPRASCLREIFVQTSAGTFILEVSRRGLFRVRFPARKKGSLPEKGNPLLRVSRRSSCFLLDLSGVTSFQRKIYAVLRKVPRGKTVSYGDLALRAGFPGAARAVGSAMRKNRIPIVIPCHRVIRGDGSMGRYSGGVAWKRRLLEAEGVIF